jgi:hypothetical protein
MLAGPAARSGTRCRRLGVAQGRSGAAAQPAAGESGGIATVSPDAAEA